MTSHNMSERAKLLPDRRTAAAAALLLSLCAAPELAHAQSSPDGARARQAPTARPGEPALQPPAMASAARGTTSCTFSLTSPASNAKLQAGQQVTIKWANCPPDWRVNLTLADVDLWTSLGTFAGNLPNNGSYTWTLPANLPCNRRYLFYIAEVANQTWHYGPAFRLSCGIEVTKARVGNTYQVTLRNAGPGPIVPLLNVGGLQTNSVPVFTVTDALPPGSVLVPLSGTGPGTWQVPSGAISGPFSFNFRFNTQATIAPGQVIGTFTFGIKSGPKNCVSETMQVSDQMAAGGNLSPISDPLLADNSNRCE